MKLGNSNNHDRDGQNVLYGEGHVEFQPTPFVGIQKDNIYTVKTSATVTTSSACTGSPFNDADSILLPTDGGAAPVGQG